MWPVLCDIRLHPDAHAYMTNGYKVTLTHSLTGSGGRSGFHQNPPFSCLSLHSPVLLLKTTIQHIYHLMLMDKRVQTHLHCGLISRIPSRMSNPCLPGVSLFPCQALIFAPWNLFLWARREFLSLDVKNTPMSKREQPRYLQTALIMNHSMMYACLI